MKKSTNPKKVSAAPSDMNAIPEVLGDAIDQLYRLRAERLIHEREVEAMRAQEGAIKAAILQQLAKLKTSAARGGLATATRTMRRTYRVPSEHWSEFWAWARRDKLGVYVHKRLAVEAIGEALAAGKVVPGVVADDVVDLALTKVSTL